MNETLKILAINDPAVNVYTNNEYKILENYNDKNIDIKFNIFPWDKYTAELEKSFDEDGKYDIIMIPGHLCLYELVKKNCLEEISYEQEDILSYIFEEMKLNNKLYLSPSFCDGHMIIYRKKMVENIVGSVNEVLTVDEFIKIAKKLKESGIETPIALKADKSEIFTDVLPYLRCFEKDIYSLNKNNEIICNIKSMHKELKKYLFLKKLSPKDTCNYTNEKIKDCIINKKVAMAVTWSGQLGLFKNQNENSEEFGYSTLKTAWNVTWAFGITKKSKNKNKAKNFLKYLRTSEIDKMVGEYCGAPVRKKNYLEGTEKYPWYKIQLNMIEKYSSPIIVNDLTSKKNEILYRHLHEIFCNEEKIIEIINKIDEDIKKII